MKDLLSLIAMIHVLYFQVNCCRQYENLFILKYNDFAMCVCGEKAAQCTLYFNIFLLEQVRTRSHSVVIKCTEHKLTIERYIELAQLCTAWRRKNPLTRVLRYGTLGLS